ncbi:YhgE/Pip domain-containing protein [Microbacterium suwonense]|uniref:ABC-2 type transporter transmembrane domain-containing protein n=1 Tax=Microbacterium suwonense TaxID=683047 RepID=A0ABN6X3V1_9MICO|nr:YhgE/Pip family protein [Microbacterium suwonense]BDZ39396.1 hypothetical protein GCM10025863_20100 [Microbacterium suwonense]
MTLSIERARSRRPITWLTLLGVLLLPALIGGILVTALQNPTDRLESMTAAVVNLDEPVTIDDQYTPLGRQLAAGLVEGSDEVGSNLTWVISNEQDAAEGLGDGTYQAVVTIPKSFSADATSAGVALKDGDGTAEQATITVTTPPDGRVADDLITNQIASVAASTMGTMLSEATVGNVLVGFTTIGDQIGEAADGAAQLADGARSAADGAAALPDGATRLADGADGLADGAGQLAGGLGTISSKAREAGAGATQLGQGLAAGAAALERDGLVPAALTDAAGTARDVAGTAAQAAAGAAQAADGSAQASAGVAQGLDGLAPGLQQLAAACDATAQPEFCAQLSDLAQAADGLRAPAGTASGLAATAAKAADGARQAAEERSRPQPVSPTGSHSSTRPPRPRSRSRCARPDPRRRSSAQASASSPTASRSRHPGPPRWPPEPPSSAMAPPRSPMGPASSRAGWTPWHPAPAISPTGSSPHPPPCRRSTSSSPPGWHPSSPIR